MSYIPPALLRAIPLAVIATGVMLVSGCSSSSSSKNDDDPQKSVAITGSAIKGTLIGAEVQACTLADCSGTNDPIATAITGADGSYTLDAKGAESSTIVLRVRYKTGATMVCDVPDGCGTDIAFGTAYPMPESLTLRSVASVDQSATEISAHITPITELVTAAAIKSRSGLGTLTADAVSKGSDAVRALLGLEEGTLLTQIKPVDVTKDEVNGASDEALQISLLGAAFAGANSDNVMQKISDMSEAVAGGSVSKTTLEGLTTSAQAVLTKAPVAEAKKTSIQAGLDAAKAKAAEKCSDNGCSSAPGQSEVSQAETNNLSKNVAAIKLLVEDVRTLGWELVPQLQNTLSEKSTHADYDPNNLLAQIETAQTLFESANWWDNTSVDGAGVPVLEGLTTVAERLITGYLDCVADSNCNITKLSNVDIEEDSFDGISWTSDDITKADNTWSVSGANYTKDSKTTTVNFSITFPEVSDLAIDEFGSTTAGTLNKNISFNVSSAKSTAGTVSIELTDVALTAELDKNLDLAVKNPLGVIKTLSFVATEAKVKNEVVTFTGSFNLQAATSTEQANLNPNKFEALLPKSVSLKGAFTSNEAKALSAEITFNFDNFNDYTYYANGTEVDGLLNFTISDGGKTITAVLGEGDHQATYTIKYQEKGTYPLEEWQTDTARLMFECTATGDANCPWRSWNNYPEDLSLWEEQYDENQNPIGYGETVYSGEPTVKAALEFLQTNNQWFELHSYFEDMETRHDTYGWIETPDDITFAEIEANTAKAIGNGHILDNDDNHILFTSTAKVTGKLSAALPEMEIGLTVKRTARFAANATLTLGWDSKHLAVLASSTGVDEQSMEDNLVLQVKDKVGTTVNLDLIDIVGSDVRGTLSKDGTKYATITEEGPNMYFITYHYDDKGKKVDKKDPVSFESLF